ncbi:MAG: hypothetical protein ACSLE0_11395 [Chitinophagaceae bacterium]
MKNFILFCSGILIQLTILSQGCSDAGFCSLGILKINRPGSGEKYSFAMGASYGAGEQNTSTINPYIEYGVNANSHFSLQVKLTSVYANGFLGSVFNLGDIFGFVNYIAKLGQHNQLSFLSGIKIPISFSNDKNKAGKPLPLDYQSSLGTYDIIEGVNFISNGKWELNAGIQIPVIHKNKNTFFPDEYADPRITNFEPTNNFKRKSDALVRAGRYLFLKKYSVTFKPNILVIYHLGNDSYENRLGKRESIRGSAGLTMNAGMIATKRFKNNNQLEIVTAAPFIVRDKRPDGLTRSIVINVQYSFLF